MKNKLRHFVILCLLFISLKGTSQICSGTMTAVWRDDFGSGSLQAAPQGSPNITSGYIFQENGVHEGNYGLVNKLDYFGSWHTVPEDNTPSDTGGYFLVIDGNSSFPVFYETNVQNVCPFTQYSFSTFAMNIDLPAFPSNQTFTFIISDLLGNQLATWNSPPIPVTNSPVWVPMGFSFNSGNNTALKLQARFNQTGYDDFAFDDFQFSVCGPTLSITTPLSPNTCADSIPLFSSLGAGYLNPVYQWQKKNSTGVMADISGANSADYTDRAPGDTNVYAVIVGDGSLACPIKETKEIVISAAKKTSLSTSICRGLSFEGYINTGIYIDTFSTITGCDSIRTIDLVVNESCTAGTNNISGIINDYAAIVGINPCENKINVDDAGAFKAGDTVLMIQMKGAAIDSSNSDSFGNIINYNNAGDFEFNYVKGKTGNSIELQNIFLHQYDATFGKVQLVRVPYFETATITGTLTCLPWDGSKGGVLVLNSATDITMDAPVDVSRKGFRGGEVGAGFSCGNTSNWAVSTGNGGTKGEGITEYIQGFEAGGARLANGGGGAYSANTGGGGGANYGAGGTGGNQSNTCGSQTQSIGGEAIDYGRIGGVLMGGAGGGGQQDDGQPVAAGGNGGGIVIIKAATLNSNNQRITANGESVTTLVRDEGGAGGGAGGSVLLYVNGFSNSLQIEANGGDGSSNENQVYPLRCHGPGGGGGGGFVGYSNGTVPAGIISLFNGGKAGLVLNPSSACYNTTHGATDGNGGGSNFNLVVPEATVAFKKNIDSVKINESITACRSFDFKGLAFTNTNPVQTWQWNFGDGNSNALQNTPHLYSAGGTYNVKLLVTDMNGCKDSTSKVIYPAGINFDFVFQQDVCNPRSVIFKAIGDATTGIFWSLGDGTVINNTLNPAHLYADTGYYTIQYSTGEGPCIDTIRKTMYAGYQNANIITTPDTTICYGTNKILQSNIDSSLNFCWSPGNFLNNINLANPATSSPGTIIYTLLGISEDNNFITNGDFANGNNGFTSGLLSTSSTPLSAGEYFISNSSINTGPLGPGCKDHSVAPGNMMIVRSTDAATTLWKQPVNITVNTNYIFSFWAQGVQSPNNAQLQLSINGNIAADNLPLLSNTCEWKRYSVNWNSGNNSIANLAILNKATATGDDYFAIDDIRFSPYSIKRETVTITVDSPSVNTITDTAVCQSIPVQLSTTGAVIYSWSPLTGLSNSTISDPGAAPDTTTKYYVTGINANGCIAQDSVVITIKPKPVVIITGDTMLCRNTAVQLSATGGISYVWSPAATLNDATIRNPVATPATNTIYHVTVTGSNSCSTSDSVEVSIRPLPVFTVSANQSACIGTSPTLNASGGNYYLWSPAGLVNDPSRSNPVATTNITTTYTVIIKETTCNDSTSLSTTLTMLALPVISAGKSNDINCAVGSANLQATGGKQYIWSPATSLDDITSDHPIASPINTTMYTVQGTDSNGCSNKANVTVLADLGNKVTYTMPNAFTPNGDGYNDCFRIRYFGLVQEFELIIFSRWGQKVFFTTNASECWDGTYKGKPAGAGNYIYFLKAKTACGQVERKGNVMLIK